MTAFKVCLWTGIGYGLDVFEVEATCEENALDLVVADLVNENRTIFFMTEEEMNEARAAGDVYELDEDEIEGWIYWDATLEGANCPVWIRSENMKIVAA